MNNKNYERWDVKYALAWKKFPSPARPSFTEVAIVKKYLRFTYLEKRKRLKVLILGSTPEFRDMCNGVFASVFCMDINPKTYEALTLLVKNKNKKEKYINANWLSYRTDQRFDFIMGDNVTGVLPLAQYKDFFANMTNLLIKDGFMVIRAQVQNEDFSIKPEESLRNYRKIYKKQGVNLYTATFNNLSIYYLSQKKPEISIAYLQHRLVKLHKKKLLSDGEFKELSFYYTATSLTLSIPKEKFLLDTFKGLFEVVAKEFGLDYMASMNNPIFVLKKT